MQAEWIAVDWGNSNLRVWAMQGASPVAVQYSDRGSSVLNPDHFEPTLLKLIEPWLGEGQTSVIGCGMIGGREGWKEAPYRQVPCKPAPDILCALPTSDQRISAFAVPGLSQAKPAYVMRGEESQMAGFLSLLPDYDGVICTPGTHCHWAHISAGEVVSFQTTLTGEMFALLTKRSTLRHSVGDGWNDVVFEEAVADAMSRPEALATKLFNLRAEDILNGTSGDATVARLSGLLIGAELAAMRPYWLGQEVTLIGSGPLCEKYEKALALQAVPCAKMDAAEATLAGLFAAYKML